MNAYLRAAALCAYLSVAGPLPCAADPADQGEQARADAALSPTVAGLHQWIVHTGNHRGLPFVLIDKRQARIWIYDHSGQLVESAPVLLGSAVGDQSVPGIGERPMAQIRPHERTTPAGRFLLEAGHNSAGENVFWLDYEAAVSLHRVRPGMRGDRRLQRLSTPTPADNRISYGCVNLPIATYNRSLHPLFRMQGGYAYVLPEVQSLQQAFPFLTPLTRRPAAPTDSRTMEPMLAPALPLPLPHPSPIWAVRPLG